MRHPPPLPAPPQGRILVSERHAAELQRELEASRASAADLVRRAEARTIGSEEQCRLVADEVAVLRAELAGRPTAEEAR